MRRVQLSVLKVAALATAVVPLLLLSGAPKARAGRTAYRQGDLGATLFYFRVVGSKQGVFHGSQTIGTLDNLIPGLGWTDETAVPIDPSTGLPSGKRTHQPITITKEWSAATPQLLEALVTNEDLLSVELVFVRVTSTNKEVINHRVLLTNALVTHYKESVGTGETNGTTGKLQLEDWSFSFQKARFVDVPSGNTAVDDTRP